MTLGHDVRRAYDAVGAAWAEGPSRVYGALARPLLDAVGEVRGERALDVGTGSGVVAVELAARGAQVFAVDASWGMLRNDAARRSPSVVGDVEALPFGGASCHVVTASFVLNHLPAPEGATRELARVAGAGGRLVATCFHGEQVHEAKGIVDDVASAHGFVLPEWYAVMKRDVHPVLGSADGMRTVAMQADLTDARVEVVRVVEPLSPTELVDWRLGMAHLASFVQALSAGDRGELREEAVRRLAGAPPLDVEVVVLSASGR